MLAYLPGWEGRYYWQYGDYRPEPELGGEAGFAALCDGARAHDTGWQAWLNPGHPGWRDDLATQIETLAFQDDTLERSREAIESAIGALAEAHAPTRG